MTQNIVWLHVESTSRCNAWCPFCPRNNQGYGLAKDLLVEDLAVDKLQKVMQHFPNLHTVQLCGNLGDPLAAKNIDNQIDMILEFDNIKNIQIHTNGSLRNKDWWKRLVEKTKKINLTVWFTIDGNEKNHSLYRQGTSYSKILENASAFINAGGKAIWQFILFDHNKNDVAECYNLSQTLGFYDFKLLKNVRSDKKSYHYKTGKQLFIKNYDSKSVQKPIPSVMTVEKKNCMHLSYPSMYLNARGQLSPCCYLDQKAISADDIVKSFENQSFFEKCIVSCGNQILSSKKTL